MEAIANEAWARMEYERLLAEEVARRRAAELPLTRLDELASLPAALPEPGVPFASTITEERTGTYEYASRRTYVLDLSSTPSQDVDRLAVRALGRIPQGSLLVVDLGSHTTIGREFLEELERHAGTTVILSFVVDGTMYHFAILPGTTVDELLGGADALSLPELVAAWPENLVLGLDTEGGIVLEPAE